MEQKFRPILYSTEMVQAELKGRKNQTRRIVKIQPKENDNVDAELVPDWDGKTDYPLTLFYNYQGTKKASIYYKAQSPFCQPGDILWVRESFHIAEENEYGVKYIYKADVHPNLLESHKFKPSIHMPKEAARIFLKVTNVRCERLQDISEEDCKAEGAVKGIFMMGPNMVKKEFQLEHNVHGTYRDGFKYIWCVINGITSWDKNPWVWVYEFEKIQKPENFLP